MDFTGRSIVVTGSGAGIGRATALAMAESGGLLTISDIDPIAAEQVAAEIQEAGGKATWVKTDVTIYEEAVGMIKAAAQEYGHVDILINNAGTGMIKPFVETVPEEWSRDIGLCLYGVMNGCHAVLSHMIERNSGKIVNICSDAGRIGEPRLAAYSAAKAGVVGFTKAVAKEVARNNILVNCVCFSTIRSESIQKMLDAVPGMEEKMVKLYPMRRVGELAEAARSIMLMCSEYVTFTTGQVLSCNGGYAMVD